MFCAMAGEFREIAVQHDEVFGMEMGGQIIDQLRDGRKHIGIALEDIQKPIDDGEKLLVLRIEGLVLYAVLRLPGEAG